MQTCPIAWHADHLTNACRSVTALQQMPISAAKCASGSSDLRHPSAICAIAHSAPARRRQSASLDHAVIRGHKQPSRNLPPMGRAMRSRPCSDASYRSDWPARNADKQSPLQVPRHIAVHL